MGRRGGSQHEKKAGEAEPPVLHEGGAAGAAEGGPSGGAGSMSSYFARMAW